MKIGISLLLLFLLPIVARSSNWIQESRQLASTRACGEKISHVTLEQVQELVNGVIRVMVAERAPGLVGFAQGLFAEAFLNEMDVYKLCGSCSEMDDLVQTERNKGTKFDYATYCQNGFPGSDATHSGLLLVPTTSSGSIQAVQYKGFMQMHATHATVSQVPSERFPDSIADEIASVARNETSTLDFVASKVDFLATMLAVSAGAVGIVPDYLGYGESLLTHNRTYFFPQVYGQTAAVLWQAAQTMVQSLSSCASLTNVVTLSGSSEGAYASVCAANALQNLGVEITTVFTGAGIFSPQTAVLDTIAAYDDPERDVTQEDLQSVSRVGIPFAIFASSTETPGFVNTGTGFRMINPKYTTGAALRFDLIRWFATPNMIDFPEFLQVTPEYLPDVINPDVLQLMKDALASGVQSPCTSSLVEQGKTDVLCEYLLDVEIWDLLETTDFPINVCNTPDDTAATLNQIPDRLFDNPLVTRYEGFAGFSITGDHRTAIFGCNLAPFVSIIEADGSQLKISEQTPWTAAELEACLAGDVTDAPAGAPAGSPSEDTSAAASAWTAALASAVLVGLVALHF